MDYTRRVAIRTWYQTRLFYLELNYAGSAAHSGRQRRWRCITVWRAASMYAPPVDPLEKRRQLGRTQLYHPITRVRPDEAAPMQAFIEKAHPISIVPKQLHSVAAPAAKDI
jgi:hypothetical protein